MNTPNMAPFQNKIIEGLNNRNNNEDLDDQTLENIQQLQEIEKSYFSQLSTGLANNTISESDKQKIVNKINEISQMRINLYKNLNNMYSFYYNNVAINKNTIGKQSETIVIVENELNQAKKRLKELEQEKNNKLRLVEINSYYGEQYNQHSIIMKIIVFTCIPVLILTFLFNRGIISKNLYAIFMIIVVFIGVVYLWKYLISAINRDNMNYQEYDWNFKPENAPSVDTTKMDIKNPWASPASSTLTCTGQECCDDGYTYNKLANKCLVTGT